MLGRHLIRLAAAGLGAALLMASCGSSSTGEPASGGSPRRAGSGAAPSSVPQAGCDQGVKTRLDAGLTYVDLNCGTGPVVHTGEVAVVSYVGKLADGKVFDSTEEHGKPLPVRLGAGTVIPGWEIGIPGMAVGGTRRLIIPPDLAYGKQGYPGVIPPNATLTFDVTLVKLKP